MAKYKTYGADHNEDNKPNIVSTGSMAKSGLKMALATIVSRLTGFLRTWSMAFALGSGTVASAYSIANGMPSFICDLIMGGVLGAAFLPVYLQAKSTGGKSLTGGYASATMNWTIIILGIATLLCVVFSPQVILTQTFTVGDGNEVYEQSVWFFRIFSLQILFYGVSGILSGLLNAERVYGLPALAPIINNIITCASFIVYAFLSSSQANVALLVLAFGTTAGVVAQAAMQLPIAIANGFRWRPTLRFPEGLAKETVRMSAATMIYIVGSLLAMSARNAFALSAGTEGPSILTYAWTWFQLPYGIVAVSVATTVFTEMGDAASKHDASAFSASYGTGMRWTLLAMIPLSALLAVVAPSVASLFQFGAFDATDAGYVGNILRMWCLSLPFYAVVMFYYKTYAALHRMMLFAVPMVMLNLLQCFLYAVLVNRIGLVGITLADLIYYAISTVVLTILLPRAARFETAGTAETSPIAVHGIGIFLAKTIGATAVLIIVSIAVVFVVSFIPLGGAVGGLISILSGGVSGLAAYVIGMKIFGMPETKAISNTAKKFISKISRT